MSLPRSYGMWLACVGLGSLMACGPALQEVPNRYERGGIELLLDGYPLRGLPPVRAHFIAIVRMPKTLYESYGGASQNAGTLETGPNFDASDIAWNPRSKTLRVGSSWNFSRSTPFTGRGPTKSSLCLGRRTQRDRPSFRAASAWPSCLKGDKSFGTR